MAFDIVDLIQRRQGENLQLHSEHVNPQFAKVLKTIGFDRVYAKAEGPYLFDEDGERYLDMLAGYGVFNVGRNHPTVRKALEDFLGTQSASLVQMEPPLLSGLLAEKLKELTPASLDTVYFTNSGTEGVETAIKYAHRATRKPRVLHCDHAFHGLSNGSLSLNGDHHFRDGFEPLLPGAKCIPFGDLTALEAELAVGDVAAFVVEPIQGKGVFIAEPEYLRGAADLCRRHDALFVLDEVQTGFGRTGKLFALEHSDVEPDILVLSKALSGGFVPVGAVLTRREIYQKVFDTMENCVIHSSTFGQGALAMTAGLATLHVIEEEGLNENAQRIGDMLIAGLNDLKSKYELIREVRGRGLMIGIEFGRPSSFKLKIGWDLAHKVNSGLFGQAIVMPLLGDHRVLTQVAGHGLEVIKLIPPLVLSDSDVNWFLEAFDKVLARSHRFPGPIWEVTSRLAKHALRKERVR